MYRISSVIVGIGASLPEKYLTNFDLAEKMDTSDEWITKRTGIKRRHVANENETTASLATKAAFAALDHARISVHDVDLIVVATVSGDYTFPATATLVQRELGIREKCVAFDVNAACSGFIFALDVADSYMKLGKSKCALVIGAETFSRLLDWSDRSTSVLFGDGAGAVVLQAKSNDVLNSSGMTERGIQSCRIYSDGAYVDALKTSGGVSTTFNSGFIQMDGKCVFKSAVEKFNEMLTCALEDNKLTLNDIDLIVPHQANARIIRKLIENFNISEDKVLITVDKYANTSAASIPLSLNEVKDVIFSKKNVILLSMGAGFTWGYVFMKM
ncbi:MAG: ketoacyl-ACP synthase III [Holosporaceae bacterium]|jgi:3-oxoacyl-[acyl-carrier-protein] synthase-3|nr:ketoacyl-ACP synthase III [Holosporaceae bacterium]